MTKQDTPTVSRREMRDTDRPLYKSFDCPGCGRYSEQWTGQRYRGPATCADECGVQFIITD